VKFTIVTCRQYYCW